MGETTDIRLKVAEPRILELPIWRNKPTIQPLHGGLSNESYDVRDGGVRYVVRFGQDYPFHHVSRERELMVSRAAHAAGFGPEIVHAEPGIMVVRFVEGQALTESDVRDNVVQVAHLVRGFHERMPRFISGPGYMFWPFHVMRDYARMLWGTGNPSVARLPELLKIGEELERAQPPLPIVFAHNDFLPANLIYDRQKLWIIDYEYAGFSTAMFDLAGVASNASFPPELSEELLAAYFGNSLTDEIRRGHAAMMCASLLREALWGMISELHMTKASADYPAYAQKNFERFDAALARFRGTYGDA